MTLPRSVVPLGLFVALLAACGGPDPRPEELTPGPPSTDLHLSAWNLKFDRKTLSAPANSQVTITLANQDSGTSHNIAIYNDKKAKDKVFASELMKGRKTESYSFTTPGPGSYYFRCDVHPNMDGTLFVQ